MCKVFDVDTAWYEEHKGDTLGGILTDIKMKEEMKQDKKRKAVEKAAAAAAAATDLQDSGAKRQARGADSSVS